MLAPVRISLKARWSLNPGHGIARFCYGLCALSRVSFMGQAFWQQIDSTHHAPFIPPSGPKTQYMALVHPLAYGMRLLN